MSLPDLASPELKRDPYPFYARLRAEAPVIKTTLPDRRTAWLVPRYADVVALLRDERLSKDPYRTLSPEERAKKMPWIPEFAKPLVKNMLDQDPPDHTRLRALVHKAFTPRFVEQLRGRIQSLSDTLLGRIRARGRTELVDDYAFPIPMTVITDMLGVPQKDRHRFRRLSERILSATTAMDVFLALPSVWLFVRYLRALTRARHGSSGEDMISALVRVEEAGDRLTEDELIGMVFLLLIAGHETTVNLISSGTLALLQHPDQLERLRADPSLMKPAVEELLRFTSPVDVATERFTREEITVGGVTIPPSELVLLLLGSANRDETQFPGADQLDVGREHNRHLAFGNGPHYCLGAPLARLEAEIAFAALIDPSFELSLRVPPESLRWRRSTLLRGLKALPLSVTARAPARPRAADSRAAVSAAP